MARPSSGYRLRDGTPVPGVTTIIGRYKDAGGLLWWAFRQGQAGKQHLYEGADRAREVGTVAHEMVEQYTRGVPRDAWVLSSAAPEIVAAAEVALCAYTQWAAGNRIEIVAQEVSLVSEIHRYGGTIDAVGRLGAELVLLDWKVANDIYPEYVIQLAAYKALWNENHPAARITGSCHLCRFSRDTGDFAHHYFHDLEDGMEAVCTLSRGIRFGPRPERKGALNRQRAEGGQHGR